MANVTRIVREKEADQARLFQLPSVTGADVGYNTQVAVDSIDLQTRTYYPYF